MTLTYLKIAFRNLTKNKLFTAINGIGLALGVACAVLLYLYIQHELSYDNFHHRAEDIYRVTTLSTKAENNEVIHMASTCAPIGQTLKEEFPEVENAVKMLYRESMLISFQDEKIYQKDIYYTDSTFFNIFDHQFIAGNKQTALQYPASVVIVKSLAERLFGKAQHALNKTIRIESQDYTVTGVTEDVPDNSHYHYTAILPATSLSAEFREQTNMDSWSSINYQTFVLLKPGTEHKVMEQKMVKITEKYSQKDTEKYNVTHTYFLQPLREIRLHSDLKYDRAGQGTMKYVWIFSVTAVIILIMAGINYVNLATARAVNRAKEVGIRKVVGGNRLVLIRQFMTESGLLVFAAFILGILLVGLAIPWFNIITGKTLQITYLLKPVAVIVLLLMLILLTLLSGFYPAWVLSSFEPVKVLKGKFGNSHKGAGLHKSLVFTQFAVSSVMIIGTLVIYQQLKYISQKDLGFEREQVVLLPVYYPQVSEKTDVLKQNLLQNPAVKDVCTANLSPVIAGHWANNSYRVESQQGGYTNVSADVAPVDENYLNLLKIQLVAGRNFAKDRKTDKNNAVIVNETFVKQMGWKEPLGKKMISNYAYAQGDSAFSEVIGVVKDFHPKSLHIPVEPMILNLVDKGMYMLVKMEAGNEKNTISFIEKQYELLEKEYPFQVYFMDEEFKQQYAEDNKRGEIFLAFSGLAILIASLGLFGLSSYTITQRTREIGIRKVLGASLNNIISLLIKDYVRLIVLAFLIACPVAYWLISDWLTNFAYHVAIQWNVFAGAIGLILLIAFATIAYQTIRAASTNPAHTLKCE